MTSLGLVRIVIIKFSVLSLKYSIILSMTPFSNDECSKCLRPGEEHASGYHVPPSEYTVCLP